MILMLSLFKTLKVDFNLWFVVLFFGGFLLTLQLVGTIGLETFSKIGIPVVRLFSFPNKTSHNIRYVQ